MAMRRATMGGILAIVVFGLVMSALGALVTTRTLSNTGSITVVTQPPPTQTIQLGVYSDSSCTTVLSSVSWGTLNPGTTSNATAYLRNEGNIPVTLSMQAGNWNPASASSYFTFSWNREGYVLAVGQIVQATLSLTVSSSITGITSFSFDIIITATQ